MARDRKDLGARKFVRVDLQRSRPLADGRFRDI